MRRSLVTSSFGVVLVLGFAAGCGGSRGGREASSPTQAATSTPAGSGPAAEPPRAGDSAPAAGAGATTTTTHLGAGGDLQGAKLGASVHTATESKGEGGPKSTQGGSASEPGRAAKDIQAIVAAHRDEARGCYDKALADHPGIEGDLDVKWVIDPQGTVTEASVDTTRSQILEPGVGACVVAIVRKLKFAPSAKGYETRAHYPFNFHPKTSSPKSGSR